MFVRIYIYIYIYVHMTILYNYACECTSELFMFCMCLHLVVGTSEHAPQFYTVQVYMLGEKWDSNCIYLVECKHCASSEVLIVHH